MTPQRYRDILDKLGISMRELGRYLDVHDTVSRRWGFRPDAIPANVAAWLEKLIATDETVRPDGAHPYPDNWKRPT